MTIASDLHDIFVKKGYLWKVGSERRIPSEDDINKALDRIRFVLDNEDDAGSLEVGRIRVQKTDAGMEVYVYIGDL